MRQLSTTVLLVCWSVGELVFIVIAYYIRNWRTQLIVATGVPLVILAFFFFSVYESSR